MNGVPAHPPRRVAVVSPFLDKRHGTERAVVECVSRLAGEYEIYLYSQRVEDLDLRTIRWRRIPRLPGPHLFNYLWWFAANHVWRGWDRLARGITPDLVFSPGVNCLDARLIQVHIVFADFVARVRPELALRRNPLRSWPRLLHRRLYYGLIQWLEARLYRRPDVSFAVPSRKVAADLARYYGGAQEITVVYHGIDPRQFSPQQRQALRRAARHALHLPDGDFVLLLVGNDWKKKGLACLLEALTHVQMPQVRLLLVGSDDRAAFLPALQRAGLDDRVRFLPPRADVEFYYAAADAYVGPSLEDAFSLPPAEAMACGLPVIVSRSSGVSELVTHARDGLILEDAHDSAALAEFIRRLAGDPALCRELGAAAAVTTRAYTWESNARQMATLFEQALAQTEGRVKSRQRGAY